MKKEYQVIGEYKGKQINEIVKASSKKQAKLKAGFNNGFGGYKMKDFINSDSIRVN